MQPSILTDLPADFFYSVGASDHHKLARDEFNGRVRAECMEAVYEVVRKVTDSCIPKKEEEKEKAGTVDDEEHLETN